MKKPYIYCLQVDLENGDGPLLFPFMYGTGKTVKGGYEHSDANFSQFLEMEPKLEIVKLSKAQWKEAEKLGREYA